MSLLKSILSSPPTFVGIDMKKRLQLLFEQMVNISRRESELRNAAHNIFASRCELPPMVELPHAGVEIVV